MGEPKALLNIEGRTFIERVAEAVASLADETIVSVSDRDLEGRLSPLLPQAVFVHDVGRGRGPIEGFLRGFRAAHREFVLVAPCDAPLLQTRLYLLLLDLIEDRDAAVPEFEVADPVRAVFRRSAVLEAFASLPGIPSPSALVDRLDSVFVSPEQLRTVDPGLVSFFDVNTREDLAKAVQFLESQR